MVFNPFIAHFFDVVRGFVCLSDPELYKQEL
jgi:hypothetical protein